MPTFYQKWAHRRLIVDYLRSGVSAINPSVDFYDIYGSKREMLFFYNNYNSLNVTNHNILQQSRFPLSVLLYANF
jgi:hypothetical protein